MKVRRIAVLRTPGIAHSFVVDNLSPEINVVVGPNACGKSSLCRALVATLWPGVEGSARLEIETSWDVDGQRLQADLRHDEVVWETEGAEVEPPAVPQKHLASCYRLGVRDLMQEDNPTDLEIAQRIRIQMAGGFDVRNVIEKRFTVKRNVGKGERRDVANAKHVVTDIKNRFNALSVDEDQLADLEDRRQAAREAEREGRFIDKAMELAERRRTVDDFMADIAAYPQGIEELRGDEIEQLNRIQQELADSDTAIRDLESDVISADEKIRKTNFETQRPLSRDIRSWLTRISILREDERELDRAQRDESQASAALASAIADLGGEVPLDSIPDISAGALDQIEASVTRRDALISRGAALRESIILLETGTPQTDLDQLDRGAKLLRAWLSAPRVAYSRYPTWLLILSVLVTIVGAGLAFYFGAAWLFLSGLGLGAVCVAAISLLTQKNFGGEQRIFVDQYEESGLAAPHQWTRDDVSERLRTLEQDIAELNLAIKKDAQRELLEAKLIKHQKDEAEHEKEKEELKTAVGVDISSEITLAEVMNRYRAYRAARSSLKAAKALVTKLTSQRTMTIDAARSYMSAFGYEPSEDSAGLEAGLQDLKDRLNDFEHASDERKMATKRLKDERGRRKLVKKRISNIYESCQIHIDDRNALTTMLSQLPEYTWLKQELDQNKRSISALELDLNGRSDLTELTQEQAELVRDEAKLAAGELEDLSGEIGGIKARVQDVRGGDTLEIAVADLADSSEKLISLCDEVQLQSAGRVLLEEIDREHERNARPPVLETAADYFRTFTHHAYELQLPDAEQPEFRAMDTSRKVSQNLAELSDGTRIQLILAIRVAFAIHAEPGHKLPLMLDEALSTADPERFKATAESLLSLANEGRQIFYMTSEPTDALKWSNVCNGVNKRKLKVIDLANVRGMQAAITDEKLFEVPESPDYPNPKGMTPEQYGVALGVPTADAQLPVEALHIFYILRNDIESLYDLLQKTRIDTVGQWASFSESGRAEMFLSRDSCLKLDTLVHCARETYELRSVGRGKYVDGDALISSEAVTMIFMPRLTSLASDLRGDAEKFLDTIENRSDSRVSGFQSSNIERLRDYLEDNGYIDSRTIKSDGEVRLEVIGNLHSIIKSGAISQEECSRVVDQLMSALEIG